MKNKKLLIGIVLLIAVLVLGIAYAATTKTLTIGGTATAEVNTDNFDVKFVQEGNPTGLKNATGSVTGNLTATMDVSGLTAKGDTATATFAIINESEDLSANLAVTTETIGNNIFSIDAELADSSIAKTEDTTVTVTVTLNETPIDDEANLTGTINVLLTATAVQPQQ